MKKKALTVILVICVAMAMTACGGNAGTAEVEETTVTEESAETEAQAEAEAEAEAMAQSSFILQEQWLVLTVCISMVREWSRIMKRQ